MVGRRKEQQILQDCLESGRPEFLVVYGRRRVGKTYLIREYFNNRFSFYATGLSNEKTKAQLRAFHESLVEYGASGVPVPHDWPEAFSLLKNLLQSEQVFRDPVSGKIVVFLDELPWMDTARSDFRSALEHFWNSWGSARKDFLLIVCGSATSWILDHMIGDHGGFYNRITRQIHLMPFTLGECEELYRANGMQMTRQQIIDSYMVFGGIPYYINCMDRRMSIAQNVDALLFQPSGQLYYEQERLLGSLFKKWDRHAAIVDALAEKKGGMLRTELSALPRIGDGEPLSKALNELEQCGFIRKYKNLTKEKYGFTYQLIDPFLLFCHHFLKKREHGCWLEYLQSPGYYAWAGNAFETVCLLHVNQIKQALGISGVETNEYAWKSKSSRPGAQIDLLIDRKDGVINLCEIKYTIAPFEMDRETEKNLQNKASVFAKETNCRKALHTTLISAYGLVRNAYTGSIQNEITGEQLFAI